MLRQELANRSQVAVVERRELPMVHVEIVIAAGAELDQPPQAGRASMTAELLDEGTPARSAIDIAEQLDFLGARLDVRAGWDATVISLQVLSARLPQALEVLADSLLNASFPEDEYERKRKERLAALLQEHDEPHLLAGKALAAGVFGQAHPYGSPVGGTHAAVAALTRHAVAEFRAAQYRPAQAMVIVVGDVDAAAVTKDLADLLVGWQGEAPVHEVAAPPVVGGRRILLVDKPHAAQAEVLVGHAGPARATPDYFSLRVLNTVLGGSFTSRLNTILRERMGVTYGAHSSFKFRRAGGIFSAGGAVFTGAAARSAQVISEQMARLAEHRPDADELQRAQSYLALGLPRWFETTEDIAARLRDQFLYGLPENYWQNYVDHIFAVTADDVMASAARHLQPDRNVVAVVADQAEVRDGLEGSGLGDVILTSVAT